MRVKGVEMAAFCACCGAEIISNKPEPCRVCGTPSHGMIPDTIAEIGLEESAGSPEGSEYREDCEEAQ